MSCYFAYGVYLSRDQLLDRCPDARPMMRAMLADYRLDFTHYSPRRGGGIADIVAAPGEVVWGAVYELNEQDSGRLDAQEGCPGTVARVSLTVLGESGPLEAWSYQVVKKRSTIEPSEGYLGLLLEGATEWGLPDDYRQFLLTFAAEEEDHDHSE